jgi:hypothetical protein
MNRISQIGLDSDTGKLPVRFLELIGAALEARMKDERKLEYVIALASTKSFVEI